MTTNYLIAERGNRLKPRRTHSRYWVLTSLTQTLIKILEGPFDTKNNILDYGCGNKPYKELFITIFTEYIGADIKGNECADIVINTDGTLPLQNKSFACVLSSQVLEHVEDPILYLEEAYRVLKDDGRLILSTHGCWKYHPDPNDYWRWTSAGIKKIVEEAGFRIEKIYSILSFPSISLQLWQDATMNKIPKIFRSIYIFFIQILMKIIDRKFGNKFSDNAGVFIVVAKKVI